MRAETCSRTFSKQQTDIFFPCFGLHKEAHDTSLTGFLIRMPMSEICQGGYPTESPTIDPCRRVTEWSPSYIRIRTYLAAGTKLLSERLWWGGDETAAGGEGEN